MKIFKNNPIALGVALPAVLLGLSANSYAGSMSLSYGELKQPFTYMEQTVTFKPVGPSLMMSFDLNQDWSVDVDYQSFDDSLITTNSFRSTSDLSSWGAGLSYFKDKWSYSFNYNASTDKTYAESIDRPRDHNHWDKTTSDSFGLSLGYGWLSGEVFYNFAVSTQMTDWDSDTRETVTRPPPPPPPPGDGPPPPPPPGGGEPGAPIVDNIRDINSGDVSSISSSFSVARYWALQGDNGILLGGMLSWNHMLSGESVLVSSTGRRPPPHRGGPRGGAGAGPVRGGAGGANLNRAGGNSLNSASGDDSYGQVAFYVSYDLTERWSVDFDTGIDIGTDSNDVIWSLSLGYFW